MKDIEYWEKNFKSCKYSDKLIERLLFLNNKVKQPIDIREVKKGIYYARKYHGTQMRQSGDPYYSHPIAVTIMVAEFVAKEVPKLFTSRILQAALLHDTIEDTELTEDMISNIFDKEVARHVEGLTRIKPCGKISSAKSLILLIKQKRYDTALIKLFDRIHNLQTLEAKSPEKAHKIIKETLKSFLVLSEILEIPSVSELIYAECYKNNLKFNINATFNEIINFDSFPFAQNKLLP
ncbi:HD domain-containing protein [Rickettsia prowazekii]|uniref:Guanosine polyphosphate pyrophosphohydrolase/synthetase n=1 Tax=Rickettsia prowazekii (strain Rp22) TaxID=449216 RepID=D5AWN9_RICPP|nr:HD domain-containing protein [Rickettsia prowazekii]EOB09669.1 Periplasmic protein TonB [Rickettsia prowazekii str. GvF12]ADE29828.1 Guanosine polyphosphate pyrophosphohydrolase/synthetase [Rickettsia prowazekii str. Rp22]AFE49129.1 guanosine-3',5'-bis(diphosphate) 3'-pyrophosphohydrolase [Rickettsia prowazekii str. Chernikova]AFE49975.1 guanosine-3',5'-bis(diphosphate) 3'-pyrophosphohydrolase [Rickettsia prowazekii str. Katsinyian]AFE50819.1 guanosine-3',5'-bis(diphosphate) 3'-pyrophosphoh